MIKYLKMLLWIIILVPYVLGTKFDSSQSDQKQLEQGHRELSDTTIDFDFSTTVFSGGSTSQGGLTLTLGDDGMFDPSGGFLRINEQHGVNITGTIPQSPTNTSYPYTISMWIYDDKNEMTSTTTIFCLPLKGNFPNPSSAGLKNLKWWNIFGRDQGLYGVYLSCSYAGTEQFVRYKLLPIASSSSWHYLSYKFIAKGHGNGFVPQTDSYVQVEFWNASGALQTVVLNETHANIDFPTIYSLGHLYNGTISKNQFSGLLYRFRISNFIESPEAGTRQNYMNSKKDYYHLLFDFTSASQNGHKKNSVRK